MNGPGSLRMTTALAALMAGALLVACEADTQPAQACHSALDCPDGTWCSLSTRTCVTPPDAAAGTEPDADAGADASQDTAAPDVPAACTEGATCDDGEPCTHTDICKNGACEGTAYSCDDGIECTTNVCDGVGGCAYGVAAGRCLIDGECFDAGADPANPCRQCLPAASQSAWQPTNEGGPCSTDPCAPSACEAGTCTVGEASCDDGDPCTDDACGEQGCEHTFNTAPCDDGDPCTAPDTCMDGACLGGDGCLCACATDDDCLSAAVNPCLGAYRCVQNSEGCGSQCDLDPTTAVVCDATGDTTCSVNTCDPTTGTCGMTPTGDGAPCDDGDATTANDACQAGVCVGEPTCGCVSDADCGGPGVEDACIGAIICEECSCVIDPETVVTCPSSGSQCTTNTCAPATGLCEIVPKPDGTPCDDADPLTADDACTNGHCQGL